MPASIAEAERNAQLVAWERLGGRWPGGDAALDAMVSDIYDARTRGPRGGSCVKVLDTDVCVEILRGNPRVLQWRRHTSARVVTTWITACELEYGAAKSAHPERARALVADL